jgi:hypothetical protein
VGQFFWWRVRTSQIHFSTAWPRKKKKKAHWTVSPIHGFAVREPFFFSSLYWTRITQPPWCLCKPDERPVCFFRSRPAFPPLRFSITIVPVGVNLGRWGKSLTQL